ncbi:DUF4623 domain-containing protein [Bacteroides salyersiae]|uniref:DUF4623 domain-containing protein n=1 Tax=Bacteroides salyersiae TaxID=291644 RepID=UPI001C8C9883|nr:DUF4623 domain-containing protein [Bacteroides salyersiae]
MKSKFTFSLVCTAICCLGLNAQSGDDFKVTNLFEVSDVNYPVSGWAPTFSANTLRGIAVHGNDLYLPVRNSPLGNVVCRLDATTGEFISALDTKGMDGKDVITGGTFVINDIAVSEDGAIYVCNMTSDARSKKWDKTKEEWVAMSGTVPFKIYKYASSEAKPEVFLSFDPVEQESTVNTAKTNAFRMGDSFTFKGTSQSGKFTTGIDNLRERCYEWTITDGVLDRNPLVIAFQNDVPEEGSDEYVALDPKFGGYGRFYFGFEDGTYIERSKDEGSFLRVFKHDATSENFWSHYVLSQGVRLNDTRYSGNSAYPFEFNNRKYLAMVDFEFTLDDLANAQGVIVDVTDWSNPVEVFRSATMGNLYKNGTTGAAVQINEKGFNAYFLSANGVFGYALESTKGVGVMETGAQPELTITVDPASQKVIFSKFINKVRVYQAQSGIEVRSASGIKEIQLLDKGAYILNIVLEDGRVVNKRVIL